MGADSIENIAEVSLRIDLQFLTRRAQAHQNGRRLASLVAPVSNGLGRYQFFGVARTGPKSQSFGQLVAIG